ncbi:unnamed protein product [Chrysoparadoxa australica]
MSGTQASGDFDSKSYFGSSVGTSNPRACSLGQSYTSTLLNGHFQQEPAEDTEASVCNLSEKALVRVDLERTFSSGLWSHPHGMLLSKNFLEGLPSNLPASLVKLDVSFNKLHDLSGVEMLPLLTHLNAAGNMLTSCEGVEQNKALEWINLSQNRIKLISGMEGLSNLRMLDISNNRLETPAQIRALSLNGALRALRIEGNAVCSVGGPVKHRVRIKHLLPKVTLLEGDCQSQGYSNQHYLAGSPSKAKAGEDEARNASVSTARARAQGGVTGSGNKAMPPGAFVSKAAAGVSGSADEVMETSLWRSVPTTPLRVPVTFLRDRMKAGKEVDESEGNGALAHPTHYAGQQRGQGSAGRRRVAADQSHLAPASSLSKRGGRKGQAKVVGRDGKVAGRGPEGANARSASAHLNRGKGKSTAATRGRGGRMASTRGRGKRGKSGVSAQGKGCSPASSADSGAGTGSSSYKFKMTLGQPTRAHILRPAVAPVVTSPSSVRPGSAPLPSPLKSSDAPSIRFNSIETALHKSVTSTPGHGMSPGGYSRVHNAAHSQNQDQGPELDSGKYVSPLSPAGIKRRIMAQRAGQQQQQQQLTQSQTPWDGHLTKRLSLAEEESQGARLSAAAGNPQSYQQFADHSWSEEEEQEQEQEQGLSSDILVMLRQAVEQKRETLRSLHDTPQLFLH